MRQASDEYRVAIPSYQRSHILNERALPMLTEGGVAPERIRIYTHEYDPTLEKYEKLVAEWGTDIRVTSQKGITAQRTHIAADFPAGTPVLNVDDDCTELVRATDPKTLEHVSDVDELVRTMFDTADVEDLYVWGLGPVVNPYFMRPGQVSQGLKFLIFTFWGSYSRPGHPVHDFTVRYKDEHELSLRAWWYDGAVLRNDGVAVKANYYTLEGGCQAAGRNLEQVEESVLSLIQQWPGLVQRNHKRKSDWPEIVLSRRPRHEGHPATSPIPGAALR